LNIYYQSLLQSGANTPGVPVGSTLLGFCSLPQRGVTSNTPNSAYVIDGCNILSGTLPGGDYGGYNLGGTSVHEVGVSPSSVSENQGGGRDRSEVGNLKKSKQLTSV
jgi:hypothetical protein